MAGRCVSLHPTRTEPSSFFSLSWFFSAPTTSSLSLNIPFIGLPGFYLFPPVFFVVSLFFYPPLMSYLCVCGWLPRKGRLLSRSCHPSPGLMWRRRRRRRLSNGAGLWTEESTWTSEKFVSAKMVLSSWKRKWIPLSRSFHIDFISSSSEDGAVLLETKMDPFVSIISYRFHFIIIEEYRAPNYSIVGRSVLSEINGKSFHFIGMPFYIHIRALWFNVVFFTPWFTLILWKI